MSILSVARRRHSLLSSILVPQLSSSTITAAISEPISTVSDAPSPLSPCAAKSRLLKEHDPDKVLSIISSVPDPSSSPASTRYAIQLAVRRLTTARRFADVETLLEARKSDPSVSEEHFVCTIILAYGFARMLDRAISTFHEVPRLCSAPPTTLSFNAVLTAAIRAKKPRKVPKLFSELSEKYSISPDTTSYGILIKSLCLSGKATKAFEIFKSLDEKSIKVTNFIYSSVLDLFYKKGEAEKAEELWNNMLEKGCHPDLATYNVKIMHQAFHGSPEDVLGSISNLEAAGLKPDAITYNYLMSCYSRSGRFEEMNALYKSLKGKSCHPNAATFKIMLNFLCEKGDFDTGIDVFKESVRYRRIPNSKTLKPFVLGLAKESKMDEAKMVIGVLRETFPENLLSGWKVVEEELGCFTDEQASGEVEVIDS